MNASYMTQMGMLLQEEIDNLLAEENKDLEWGAYFEALSNIQKMNGNKVHRTDKAGKKYGYTVAVMEAYLLREYFANGHSKNRAYEHPYLTAVMNSVIEKIDQYESKISNTGVPVTYLH